jgi:flagellar biosynthesis chaperone FliJ
MESAIDLLINGSPMAAFAAFLIYLYSTMQKRMDGLVANFQTQLDSIRHEYKQDTEALRLRYDGVIETYNSERTEIRVNVSGKVVEMERQIAKVQGEIDALAIAVDAQGDAARAAAHQIEQSFEILKEMREDAKIRHLAKQVAAAKPTE